MQSYPCWHKSFFVPAGHIGTENQTVTHWMDSILKSEISWNRANYPFARRMARMLPASKSPTAVAAMINIHSIAESTAGFV